MVPLQTTSPSEIYSWRIFFDHYIDFKTLKSFVFKVFCCYFLINRSKKLLLFYKSPDLSLLLSLFWLKKLNTLWMAAMAIVCAGIKKMCRMTKHTGNDGYFSDYLCIETKDILM